MKRVIFIIMVFCFSLTGSILVRVRENNREPTSVQKEEIKRDSFSDLDYEVGCNQGSSHFCLASENEETYKRCISDTSENCKTWAIQYKNELGINKNEK